MDMNIGINLRNIREENDKSIEDIALVLEVAKITYNHYETSEKIIPIERLNDLSNYYGVSIDYILDLNKQKKYENSNKTIMQELSAARIKEFRKDNKLTQAKLASILNTTTSTISGYEINRFLIPTSFLLDICKKYNISADYLLGKIDGPKYIK